MDDMNLFGDENFPKEKKKKEEKEKEERRPAALNEDLKELDVFGDMFSDRSQSEKKESNDFKDDVLGEGFGRKQQKPPKPVQQPMQQSKSVQPPKPVQQPKPVQRPVQQPVQRKFFPQQETKLKPSGKDRETKSAKFEVVKVTPATLMQIQADTVKFDMLKRKFEKGRLVLAMEPTDGEPQPVMYLLQIGSELMAYKYLKSSLDVAIPTTVCGLPVRYVHPNFLHGSLNPLSGVKFQNFMSNFEVENIASFDKEAAKNSLKGVKSIKLPITLTSLPPGIFRNCFALKELVIPESVESVSCRAFEFSYFRDIYFEGKCPVGFKLNGDLPKKVTIHFRPEFAESFMIGR